MKKITQIAQIFMLIFLSIQSFASVQSEKSLESVIQTTCPFIGGDAVYKARTLNTLFNPLAEYNDRVQCIPQTQNRGIAGNENNTTNLDSLEPEKVQRVVNQLKTGIVEIPIVVKFNHKDYDLLAGNTRLATIVKGGGNPKLWVVDMSNDTHLSPKELDISHEMDQKHKYDAWNFSDAEYYTGMQGKR